MLCKHGSNGMLILELFMMENHLKTIQISNNRYLLHKSCYLHSIKYLLAIRNDVYFYLQMQDAPCEIAYPTAQNVYLYKRVSLKSQ